MFLNQRLPNPLKRSLYFLLLNHTIPIPSRLPPPLIPANSNGQSNINHRAPPKLTRRTPTRQPIDLLQHFCPQLRRHNITSRIRKLIKISEDPLLASADVCPELESGRHAEVGRIVGCSDEFEQLLEACFRRLLES